MEGGREDVQGRSGRVALPRVNGTLAGLAIFEMVERLRRVERAVDGRKSVVAMARMDSVMFGFGRQCNESIEVDLGV